MGLPLPHSALGRSRPTILGRALGKFPGFLYRPHTKVYVGLVTMPMPSSVDSFHMSFNSFYFKIILINRYLCEMANNTPMTSIIPPVKILYFIVPHIGCLLSWFHQCIATLAPSIISYFPTLSAHQIFTLTNLMQITCMSQTFDLH